MKENNKEVAVVRVVDDDAAVRRGIAFLLENEGWKVKTYPSGPSFLTDEASLVPGCIILDVKMEPMSGLDVHKELLRRESAVPLIFLTAHGDVPMAVDAIKAGAVEFLQKPLDPEKLLELVDKYISLDISRRSVKISMEEASRRLESLTERENQILNYALRELSNQEIAEELKLSKRTVENHRQAAYNKMSVSSLKELKAIFQLVRAGERT